MRDVLYHCVRNHDSQNAREKSWDTTRTISYFARSPEKICGFFLRICLGISHWKTQGIFWWIFSGLRFQRNEARKFGKTSEQNSGQNSGRNLKNSGNCGGNPNRGLANEGLAQKAPIGPKRALSGNFCSSLVAVGCGGIGPDRPP